MCARSSCRVLLSSLRVSLRSPQLALLRRPARRPLDPFDAALVCAIFVPVKVQRYFPDTFLPDVRIALVGPRWPHLSVLLTTAFNTMLLVFLVLRPLRDLRLSLSVTLRTGLRFFVAAIFAAAGVAAFAALESDSEPQEHLSLRLGLRVFFAYWLCFALPLETFFRGVLQNLLHSALDVRAAVREYTAADSKPTQTSLTLSLSAIGLSASETASALAGPLPAQVRDSLAVPLLPQHQPDSEPPATHWAPSRTEARDFVPWHEEHKAFLSRGVFCWLAFPHLRDLLVLIVSGALFAGAFLRCDAMIAAAHASRRAVCIVDWRDFSLSLFLSSFALSVLLGWLWRHTSHTLLSSLLHAGAVFVARYALGKNVWDQQ
jgi:membrane protease YdiL (CAAX protease family)